MQHIHKTAEFIIYYEIYDCDREVGDAKYCDDVTCEDPEHWGCMMLRNNKAFKEIVADWIAFLAINPRTSRQSFLSKNYQKIMVNTQNYAHEQATKLRV
jgi:hypothetical protein